MVLTLKKEPDMQKADIWPWTNSAYVMVKLGQGEEEWGLLLEKEVVPVSENNSAGSRMKMAGILSKK